MGQDILRVAVVLGEMGNGGIENVVMNYYRHIDHDKVQFDFYAHKDSNNTHAKEIEQLGGRLFLIPSYSHIMSYCKTLQYCFEKNRYQIVHVHLNTLSVFAQFSAWMAGIPVRITHNHSTAGTGKGEWKRNIAKYVLRLFANVFPTDRCACTLYAGEWLFGKRYKNEIKIWRDAIDIEHFQYNDTLRSEYRDRYGFKDGELVLGHVGRFMPQKNQLFLVDIFAELKRNMPSSHLVMVGEGKDEQLVKQKVNELGLEDSVIFAGPCQDVNPFYQMFDVFALPSIYEGLGMVAIEAQVSGLPVLISDVAPDDVMITENIRKLKLKDSAVNWANAIVDQFYTTQRISHVDAIRKAGYDIKCEAQKLTEWYLSLKERKCSHDHSKRHSR